MRLAYCGMGLRDCELLLAASGGHGDYAGNEVTSIDLAADLPAWQLRAAKSSVADTISDAAYYRDGKPSSRHTYWSTHYSTTRNRLMLHRSRFVYGSAVSFDATNGFDLGTNRWDAAGTWRNGYTAGCRDAYDNVWALSNYGQTLVKWTAATDTWAVTGSFGGQGPLYPLAHDSRRNQLFALCWGNGEAYGSGLHAAKYTDNGSVRTAITFNASTALSQLQADQPAYAAMEYDPIKDCFYFYSGANGQQGRIYVITPNPGSVWDVAVLPLGPGSAIPPAVSASGLCSRFRYVPALRGCVLMVSGSAPIYFIRTS